MITLKVLTKEQYNTADSFYRSQEFRDSLNQGYWDYIYTSCLQYLETGDLKALNHPLQVSKIIKGHVIQDTQSIVSLVACHKQVLGQYKGKANTRQLAKRRASAPQLKGKAEAIINKRIAAKEVKANTFNPEQKLKAVINALAQLYAHDIDVDITAIVKAAHAKEQEIELKDKIADVVQEGVTALPRHSSVEVPLAAWSSPGALTGTHD